MAGIGLAVITEFEANPNKGKPRVTHAYLHYIHVLVVVQPWTHHRANDGRGGRNATGRQKYGRAWGFGFPLLYSAG